MCPPGNAYNQPYVLDWWCLFSGTHVSRSICDATQRSFHPPNNLAVWCVCLPTYLRGRGPVLVDTSFSSWNAHSQKHTCYLLYLKSMQVLQGFKNQSWKLLSVWKRHIYIFWCWLSKEKWGAGFWCQGVNYVSSTCCSHCCHISSPNHSRLTKLLCTTSSGLLLLRSFCLPSEQE